jgi:hypothetical protein
MEYKFKVGDVVKLKQFPPIDKNQWDSGFTKLFDGKENKFTINDLGNYGFGYNHNRCIKLREVNCWHPEDEFELYQEESKFKEGDIVVCLPEPNVNPGNTDIKGGAGYVSNLCFKVRSTDDYPTYQVLWKVNGDYGVYSNSVRYATEKEIDEYNKLNKPYYITDMSKPKFEVDKWYKNLGFDGTYIAKAIKGSKIKGNEFYCGDYITPNKHFRKSSKSTEWLKWNTNTCEIPISEIQQYLPNDHPDKIKEEEWVPKVGDWVRVTTDSYISHKTTKSPVFQIQSISDGNKLHSKETGKVGWIWLGDVIKAEPHEIPVESKQEFSSLDLLEEAERRYPVGTKYRCAGGGKDDESIVEEDTVWKFWDDECNKIDAIGKYFVYYKGKWAEIISSSESKLDVEYASKSQKEMEPISVSNYKFKIGDKVRVLSQSHGWGAVKAGDIGVIEKIYDDGDLSVDFPTHYSWTGKPKCFELVEEADVLSYNTAYLDDKFEYQIEYCTIPPLKVSKVEQSFDKPIKIKRVSNKRKLTIV